MSSGNSASWVNLTFPFWSPMNALWGVSSAACPIRSAFSRQNSTPPSMRLSVRKIGRYSYQSLPSAGRVIALLYDLPDYAPMFQAAFGAAILMALIDGMN